MKMDYQYIKVERDEGVVLFTLNSDPDRYNPWFIPMMEELTVALDMALADPDDRVFVFTGAGENFSAGGDVPARSGRARPEPIWMKTHNGQRGLWNAPTMTAEERMQNIGMSGWRIHMQVYNSNKPTIAAVNGMAAGAGCDLAFACDIRIGTEDTKLCQVYVRRALPTMDGGAYWTPFHLPHGVAMHMLLTGDVLSAQDAYRFGVLNQIVDKADLLPTTMDLARRLAKGPSVTHQLVKHMVRQLHMTKFPEHRDLLQRASAAIGETRDSEEGWRSFMEKRTPVFQGR